MLRKKKCLTTLAIVSATFLLCLTAGFGVINAAELQSSKEISESSRAESQESDVYVEPLQTSGGD